MRGLVRRVAFIGVPDRGVAESLREYGYKLEAVEGESFVGLTRHLYRMRAAVVHARTAHLKSALVARLLDIPLLVHAGRDDARSGATARASRLASRTLCAG